VEASAAQYRLVQKIAAGGMAEIFLAETCANSPRVVVKRMYPNLARNDALRRMFIDEARIAARLHHPNIVETSEINVTDEVPFFVMEYLQGYDVRSLLKTLWERGIGLPLAPALEIVRGLAAGLNHAHDLRDTDGTPLGLVHRDVSPANIFLTFDGLVKVIDFGIARAARREGEATQIGIAKGKIPYMSPEQCRNEPLDRRSDIFSVGIILYELTTGHRLFKGNNDFDILRKIADDPIPSPSATRPGYPAQLERIVTRALARRPQDRYDTAAAFQVDLEAYVGAVRLDSSPHSLGLFMRQVFAGAPIPQSRGTQGSEFDP
jgi:eukaryotic-like serine/threonine-protein kinase